MHRYVIEDLQKLGFLMRGEIIWNKASSATGSTAWGSWMSATNPTLRDIHEYILVLSKDTWARPKYKGRENTISRDDFLESTRSVWQFPTESAKRIGHPSPFPVELPRRCIELYTYSEEVVLDPFMGSGTTAIAALQTGRKFVGSEISAKYLNVCYRRLASVPNSFAHIDPLGRVIAQGRKAVCSGFDEIANANYYQFIGKRALTDIRLQNYFNSCFQHAIDEAGCYPAWVCLQCVATNNPTAKFGNKPDKCPDCRSARVV